MKRHVQFALLLLIGTLPLQCATLERLSLDDMIAKSTAIVRGTVVKSWASAAGPVIYTHYSIQVSERYKGSPAATTEVVVPGGEAGGLRQSFSGAPALSTGDEYVLFLRKARDGMNWVIGLTQGLFSLAKDPTDPLATRAASRELMLDPATGKPVKDQTLVMRLSELRSRISDRLAASDGVTGK